MFSRLPLLSLKATIIVFLGDDQSLLSGIYSSRFCIVPRVIFGEDLGPFDETVVFYLPDGLCRNWAIFCTVVLSAFSHVRKAQRKTPHHGADLTITTSLQILLQHVCGVRIRGNIGLQTHSCSKEYQETVYWFHLRK